MKPAGIPFECTIDVAKAYEDEGRWVVEGFAATSDFDLQEDIISQEAIEASAKDLIENSTVLHNHKPDESIGKVLASEARKGGLFLKILVSKTVPELWQKIKEGVLNKFSVRGKILEAKKQWIAKLHKFARLIIKMHLVEVSLVAVPANPKARAIRWYIEKAMDEFEANGGEIAEMEGENTTAGTPNEVPAEGATEIIEEEVVLYEASGETEEENLEEHLAKAIPPNAPTTVRMQEIAVLVGKLLPGEQDPERRRLLGLIRVMATGAGSAAPPPAASDASQKTEGETPESAPADPSQPDEPDSPSEEVLGKAGRKISATRLNRLKQLMAELQKIIDEAAPGEGETQKDQPSEGMLPGFEKLTEVETAIDRISKALGIDAGKDAAEPESVVKAIDTLSQRIETLEGRAGTRASLEGQEELPGSRKPGGSLWKGVV